MLSKQQAVLLKKQAQQDKQEKYQQALIKAHVADIVTMKSAFMQFKPEQYAKEKY